MKEYDVKIPIRKLSRAIFQAVIGLVLISIPASVWAYVEIPYTLGRLMQESTNIVLVRVEKVDKEKNLILYKKIKDIKGSHAAEVVRHNIGRGGFHPREWQFVMNWAAPGKIAICFHNGAASETCIGGYWYQAYPNGDWWNMSHGEPYLLRTFAGQPEKLEGLVASILAGQEVIVPCMIDQNKEQLQLATAKVQRLRASLKLQDYNAARDFVGWGGDDFRTVTGMPNFSRMAVVSRVDPGARSVAVSPPGEKGNPLCCFAGEGRVSVVQIDGPAIKEISLPSVGGAKGAAWADYNGDGKPDLLLASPKGLTLLTNLGDSFRDDSSGLPMEWHNHVTAAVWMDADGDGHPDILCADGFRGLRLLRNVGKNTEKVSAEPKIGPWYYAGPFDHANHGGFKTTFPPEAEKIDLKATYPGKANRPVTWKEGKFPDGQFNNLALLEDNNDVVVYLYREIEVSAAVDIPVSIGADGGLAFWLNGEKQVSVADDRVCTADQHLLTLKLRPGLNTLLFKVCKGVGPFEFYFAAKAWPTKTPPLFVDATEEFGLGRKGVGGSLKGDHLVVADLNNDGRSDFLFSAGGGIVALNTPKGFVEQKNSGVRFKSGGVGPLFFDFNNDKNIDLFVPQADGGKLFAGRGDGTFVDVTAQAGALAEPLAGANCAFAAPFRKTGQIDLFVGCLKGANRYFRNDGGKFVDATAEQGLDGRVFNTRGIGMADVNGDGSLDLLFANEGQESSLILGKPQDSPPTPAEVQK